MKGQNMKNCFYIAEVKCAFGTVDCVVNSTKEDAEYDIATAIMAKFWINRNLLIVGRVRKANAAAKQFMDSVKGCVSSGETWAWAGSTK
jgi:hypothetical protein